MTRMISLPPDSSPDHPALREAARLLRAGELVAFPTETVYGLGANGLDADAVGKIFAVKGRPGDNPLILHVASMREAEALTEEMPASARCLAARFWPGPLTLVVPRAPNVPALVSADLPTIAIRMPAHPIALALIRAADLPIAAPSANISGRPSPTTAAHVLADLEGRIGLIIDGGATTVGLESTVLDLTTPKARLLRPGGVTLEALQEVLGPNGVEIGGLDADRPAAPGMKYRHYAPRAPLTILQGGRAAVLETMAREMESAKREDRRLAALVHSEDLPSLTGLGLVLDLGPRDQPELAGRRLFGALRACDDAQVEAILAEAVAEDGMGRAVMNRLLKAAGGRMREV